MKKFWFTCAGMAGLGISILAIIPRPRADVTGGGASQAPLEKRRLRPGEHHDPADLDLEKMPAGAEREAALRALAHRWAEGDLPAAERWAESLTVESERKVALDQLAIAWGKRSPKMAIELAQRHYLSQAIVDMITEQWGKSDLPAATAWVAELPSSEARENALLQVFAAHAEIDPAATAVLVTQQLPPGPAQEEAAMTVLYHWLRIDETAAADWVKDFPKGEFRIRAEAEIQGFRSYHNKGSATPP